MERIILILLGIVALCAGVTYLLSRVMPRVKSVKYLPALLCLIVGFYYFYLFKTVRIGVGFQDLAHAIYAMMSFVGFISGLVTGLILDFVSPRFKS